ncbi:MAG: dihydropteroate synthase [Elusimicrobiota bacterium]|jgi:dihydropteroate synthase|nr:dihydropteroate synthase [Elusimicrobiota bacterium]
MLLRKAVITNFDGAARLVSNTKAMPFVHKSLAKKGLLETIIIEKIDNRAAAILKQEALSCGADLAVSDDISRFKKGLSDAVLFANIKQIEILSSKLILQPFGLKDIAVNLKDFIKDCIQEKIFRYKDKTLRFDKPAVMGIVNVDPNSFSGDGLTDPDKAAKQAAEFERLGARIIDLGAESSRPGVKLIDYKIEIKRLIPSLKKIRKTVKIPISIDTYKYETAKAALDEGADIINDIFALQVGKEKLGKLIAKTKAGLILMHSKGKPLTMQKNPSYKNCISEVYEFLSERKKYALNFGIDEDFISVDPGIGFGKQVEHNMELINNFSVFSPLGAITAGVSRKNFVRTLCGADKIYFIAANFLSVLKGAHIVRVHDVKETINVLKLI